MRLVRSGMESWPLIAALVKRELKDALRDWRIMMPIGMLSVFFPWLMDIAAQLARDYVARYGAYIIAERMYPLLVMVVGFFPLTYSLVIALESFAGEKERYTLEPLLASPLTDLELYLGKFLASLLLPLAASLFSIALYISGLRLYTGYFPPPVLLVQALVLTLCEAMVMVAGAVVVSSNATSVKAANLLASFIIVPMGLVLLGIGFAMFWANYNVLWWVVAGLITVAVLLVRMGLALFNREHLLTRRIERVDIKGVLGRFYELFVHRPGVEDTPFSLGRIYRRDLALICRETKLALISTLVVAVAGALIGVAMAFRYPLPPLYFDLSSINFDELKQVNLEFLPPLRTEAIFFYNLRSVTLSSLLSIITLGVMPALLALVNLGQVGFFLGEAWLTGNSPLNFAIAFILPHGIFEIPAALFAAAVALRLGAVPVSPEAKGNFRDALLLALADWLKVLLFVTLPLLLVAAFVEANITPLVARWLYG